MQFKDLSINDIFVKPGQNAQYTKVPEVRVSCCKVKCNAKRKLDNADAVFRPLDEVTRLEKK